MKENETTSHCILNVFRSCTDHPFIRENREKVFKLVITSCEVETITKNARHEPDWLLADVEVAATFRFENISASQLREDLFETLHLKEFDCSFIDALGQTIKSAGWFHTNILYIEKAVEILKWMQKDSISDRFWAIVESDEFRQRFQSCHPIIRQNGYDFYQIDNLEQRLKTIRAELLKARTPRSVNTLKNMVSVTKDWIKQVEWIEQRLECLIRLPSTNRRLSVGWAVFV